MIRIDLGKDESAKTTGGGANVTRKVQDIAKTLKLPPEMVEMLGDVKSLAFIGIMVALALLPHLFFSQYRAYVNSQHVKEMERLKQETTAVTAEISKYSAFQSELESYESQKKLVNERLEGVRALLEVRNTPVNVLDAVGQSLPLRVWLDKIDFTVNQDGPNVEMTGKAYSNEEISDFMDKLGESIYLQDVKLTGVDTVTERNINLRSFELVTTGKPRQPASTKPGSDQAAAPPTAPPPAK